MCNNLDKEITLSNFILGRDDINKLQRNINLEQGKVEYSYGSIDTNYIENYFIQLRGIDWDLKNRVEFEDIYVEEYSYKDNYIKIYYYRQETSFIAKVNDEYMYVNLDRYLSVSFLPFCYYFDWDLVYDSDKIVEKVDIIEKVKHLQGIIDAYTEIGQIF